MSNCKMALWAGLVLACIRPGWADVYGSLRGDWSDTANPHGQWALLWNGNPLAYTPSWPFDPFAYPQQGFGWLPFWFRSDPACYFTHDWIQGDIIVHTANSGVTCARWSCPESGSLTISGHVWEGRDNGRGNHWWLTVNGVPISDGYVAAGDIYSRANPFDFATGSGGPAALADLPVAAGDEVALWFERTSSYGDYVGVVFDLDLRAPVVAAREQPAAFLLGEAHPNPFNPSTTLSFTMSETGPATLEVFDLAGRRVATLWDGLAERGTHTVTFDAGALPSGLYFYRLSAPQGTQTRKMILGK
jgi:hypothetical protein